MDPTSRSVRSYRLARKTHLVRRDHPEQSSVGGSPSGIRDPRRWSGCGASPLIDGRALAIRRAQDAHRRRASHGLGITPILLERASAPRASSGPISHLVLAPPFDRTPPESEGASSHIRPSMGPGLRPPPPGGGSAGPSFSLGRPEPPAFRSPPPAPAAAPQLTFLPHPISPSQPHNAPSLCSGVHPYQGARAPSEGAQRAAGDVTICREAESRPPSFLSLPLDSGVHAPSSRREGLSTAPAVRCSLPPGGGEPPFPIRGKGAKHARVCAGPWASALADMPPMPLTGAKRAQAGLAAVPLSSSDIAAIRRERAACALASILPWAAAAGKAKVARIFDLLVRAHLALRSARRALAADPSLLGTGDASWGSAGPFAVARATPLPLLLTHSL
ncbi:hypothetical protein AB1Y20_016251 [Prymnesium parvum]|uniref:Uncharacterized protein n=1 Tax=Prymnesium parvum TaxID=97485 RepID=A0AB34IE85_PRYPA